MATRNPIREKRAEILAQIERTLNRMEETFDEQVTDKHRPHELDIILRAKFWDTRFEIVSHPVVKL